MIGYDQDYGYKAISNWGEGDERSRYAIGSVVHIPDGFDRVDDAPGVSRVISVFSIGEDASFYYRVSPMAARDRGRRWVTDWGTVSDRVHVIPGECDYTLGWTLLFAPDGGDDARRRA